MNQENKKIPKPKNIQKESQAKLKQELEEARTQALRLAADFENFRRHNSNNLEQTKQTAKAQIVLLIIPILNNLSLAFRHTPPDVDAKWLEGINHILRQLEEVFNAEGFSLINETTEPFSPQQHEAISYEPSELAEGTILEVIDIGLRQGDKVIKPARVRVSAGKKPTN